MCLSANRLEPRIILIAAAVILLLVGATGPSGAAVHYGRIVNVASGDVLWLHSGSEPKFEKIGLIPHDARHIRSYGCRHAVTHRWCQIRYHGVRGCIAPIFGEGRDAHCSSVWPTPLQLD